MPLDDSTQPYSDAELARLDANERKSRRLVFNQMRMRQHSMLKSAFESRLIFFMNRPDDEWQVANGEPGEGIIA